MLVPFRLLTPFSHQDDFWHDFGAISDSILVPFLSQSEKNRLPYAPSSATKTKKTWFWEGKRRDEKLDEMRMEIWCQNGFPGRWKQSCRAILVAKYEMSSVSKWHEKSMLKLNFWGQNVLFFNIRRVRDTPRRRREPIATPSGSDRKINEKKEVVSDPPIPGAGREPRRRCWGVPFTTFII